MANSTSIEDLTELRDDLYGGNWQVMFDDLVSKLDKRPHNHRMATQIKVDIAVIKTILENHKNSLDQDRLIP